MSIILGTSVEKLFHLNPKTSGEAKAIVAKSPLTNEGFDSAWAALRDRFENKRLLVNSQLKLLFNLSSVSSESGSERPTEHNPRVFDSAGSFQHFHKELGLSPGISVHQQITKTDPFLMGASFIQVRHSDLG